jgi:ribosomal-protein-alanine N-acetyltransferase
MSNRSRYGKYGDAKRISRLKRPKAMLAFFRKPPAEGKGIFGLRNKQVLTRDPIAIRAAEAQDAIFVQKLARQAFQRYGQYDEMLPAWFEAGFTETLLALMGKKPVGFAMLGMNSEGLQAPSLVELLAIAVAPSKKRMGFGGLLMLESMRMARQRYIETVVLHTAVDNKAAQGLFKQHGFIEVQTKRNFYPNGQDAVMMVKHLEWARSSV